jgi:hypothetical protein
LASKNPKTAEKKYVKKIFLMMNDASGPGVGAQRLPATDECGQGSTWRGLIAAGRG